jgi:hypothetical protein
MEEAFMARSSDTVSSILLVVGEITDLQIALIISQFPRRAYGEIKYIRLAARDVNLDSQASTESFRVYLLSKGVNPYDIIGVVWDETAPEYYRQPLWAEEALPRLHKRFAVNRRGIIESIT